MDDVNSNLTESSMEKVELAEVANQKSSSTALEEKEINDDRFQDVVEEHMMNTRHQFNLVQSKSEEAHKLLVQDYKLLEAKRENIKEMSKKVTDVNFKDIVKLNVGGERFETSLDTLTKFPNSLFAMMFSGSVATKQGKDDTYFIDRDGSHFRYSTILVTGSYQFFACCCNVALRRSFVEFHAPPHPREEVPWVNITVSSSNLRGNGKFFGKYLRPKALKISHFQQLYKQKLSLLSIKIL